MHLADRLRQDGYASIEPVLFFALDGLWSEFSNVSGHAVELPDPWTSRRRHYPSEEHRYQAVKAADQDGHD